MIERGSTIIGVEYIEAENTAFSIELPARAVRLRSLEIPNLPAMGGLIIKAGDQVLECQPIARYMNENVLEVQRRRKPC